MMKESRWAGVFPALWTPTDQGGQIDEPLLRRNLDFMLKQGVHGILALGSTGEFPLLDLPERRRVLEVVAENASGRPIIVNVSDIRPRVVAELGRFARDIGAAAVAVLPPYFFSVAQDDLVEFFLRAADAAQLPTFLYNYPERTGTRIELETLDRVCARIPIAGFKQSGADFEFHRGVLERAKARGFAVLTGFDTRLAEAMAMGVDGSISGMANAVPELLLEIYNGCVAQRSVAEASSRLQQLGALLDELPFPLNIAALMQGRGRPVGEPKSIVAESTRLAQKRLENRFRALYASWGFSTETLS